MDVLDDLSGYFGDGKTPSSFPVIVCDSQNCDRSGLGLTTVPFVLVQLGVFRNKTSVCITQSGTRASAHTISIHN
jgi:hypothetical protein